MSYGFYIKRINRNNKSVGKGLIKSTQVFTKDDGYTIHHAFTNIPGEGVREIVAIYKGDKQIYGPMGGMLRGTTIDGFVPNITMNGKAIPVDIEGKKWEAQIPDPLTNCTLLLGGSNTIDTLDLSEMKTDNVTSMNRMFAGSQYLQELDLSKFDTTMVSSMSSMFQGCKKLKELDLSSFDTVNVLDMDNMFSGCESLQYIDMTTITVPEDAEDLFMGCKSLKKIKVDDNPSYEKLLAELVKRQAGGSTEWKKVGDYLIAPSIIRGTTTNSSTPLIKVNNTVQEVQTDGKKWEALIPEEVTATSCVNLAFSQQKIDTIDFSSFDSSHVTTFNSALRFCESLVSVDADGLDTSSATDMQYMFADCGILPELDLSSFDTSKVKNFECMFFNCKLLEELNLSGWNTSSATSFKGMFNACESIKELDLSSFDTSKVTNMSQLFDGCTSLVSLDLSKWKFDSLAESFLMFEGCDSLLKVHVKGCSAADIEFLRNKLNSDQAGGFTSWVLRGEYLVPDVIKGTTIDGSLPTVLLNGVAGEPYHPEGAALKWECVTPGTLTSLAAMLRFQDKVDSVDIFGLDTSSVTNMSEMFSYCTELANVDVSPLDTTNVTSMSEMFNGCGKLTDIDISHFNTSKVTNMFGMFSMCEGLTDLDFSSFDTRKVTNMGGMFMNCNQIENLNLSTFKTPVLNDTNAMFMDCKDLKTIDMSNFDLRGVTTPNMELMFYGCDFLEKVRIANCSDETVEKLRNQLNKDFAGASTLWIRDGEYLVRGKGLRGTTNQPDGKYNIRYNKVDYVDAVIVKNGKFEYVPVTQINRSGVSDQANEMFNYNDGAKYIKPLTLDYTDVDLSGLTGIFGADYRTEAYTNFSITYPAMPATAGAVYPRYHASVITAPIEVRVDVENQAPLDLSRESAITEESIRSVLTNASTTKTTSTQVPSFHRNAIEIIAHDPELLSMYRQAIKNGWKYQPINVLRGTTDQSDGTYKLGYNGAVHSDLVVKNGSFEYVILGDITSWGYRNNNDPLLSFMFDSNIGSGRLNPTSVDYSDCDMSKCGNIRLYYTASADQTLRSVILPSGMGKTTSNGKPNVISGETVESVLRDIAVPIDNKYPLKLSYNSNLSYKSIKSVLTNASTTKTTDTRIPDFHQNAIEIIARDPELLAMYNKAIDNGWKYGPISVIKGTTDQADGTYTLGYNGTNHNVKVVNGKFEYITADVIKSPYDSNGSWMVQSSTLRPTTYDLSGIDMRNYVANNDFNLWYSSAGNQVTEVICPAVPSDTSACYQIGTGPFPNLVEFRVPVENAVPCILNTCPNLSRESVLSILTSAATSPTKSTITPSFHQNVYDMIVDDPELFDLYNQARKNGYKYPLLSKISGTSAQAPGNYTYGYNGSAHNITVKEDGTWSQAMVGEIKNTFCRSDGYGMFDDRSGTVSLKPTSVDFTRMDAEHMSADGFHNYVNSGTSVLTAIHLPAFSTTNNVLAWSTNSSTGYNNVTTLTVDPANKSPLKLAAFKSLDRDSVYSVLNNCCTTPTTSTQVPNFYADIYVMIANDPELYEMYNQARKNGWKYAPLSVIAGTTAQPDGTYTLGYNTARHNVTVKDGTFTYATTDTISNIYQASNSYMISQGNTTLNPIVLDLSRLNTDNLGTTNFKVFQITDNTTYAPTTLILPTITTTGGSYVHLSGNIHTISTIEVGEGTSVPFFMQSVDNLSRQSIFNILSSHAATTSTSSGAGMLSDAVCQDIVRDDELYNLYQQSIANGYQYGPLSGVLLTTSDGTIPTIVIGGRILSSVLSKDGIISEICTRTFTSLENLFVLDQDKVVTVDLRNVQTANVTTMANMFKGCTSLESVAGIVNTSNVTDMSYMFSGCSSIRNIDLTSFDFSKVTTAAGMFANCSALETLDFSGCTIIPAALTYAFDGCTSLSKVKVAGCDVDDVVIPLRNALNYDSAGGSTSWHLDATGEYLVH